MSKEKKIEELLNKKVKIKKVEKAKHSVISLLDKTNEIAKEEDKTTVLALCQKHRKGFWIVVKETDLQKVIDVQRKDT